jgi:hypothetical protein
LPKVHSGRMDLPNTVHSGRQGQRRKALEVFCFQIAAKPPTPQRTKPFGRALKASTERLCKEGRVGVEPTRDGFAIRCLSHLATAPLFQSDKSASDFLLLWEGNPIKSVGEFYSEFIGSWSTPLKQIHEISFNAVTSRLTFRQKNPVHCETRSNSAGSARRWWNSSSNAGSIGDSFTKAALN